MLKSNQALIRDDIIASLDLKPSLQKETSQYINDAILYTIEAIRNNNALIIKHYLHWMHSTLKHDGLDSKDIKKIFTKLKTEFYDIDEHSKSILDFSFDDVLSLRLEYGDTELNQYARQYLKLILNKDRHGAAQYVNDLINKNFSIPEIYSDVMTPTLYEIGWLWQQNKITTADEHLATAITQYVMTTLYEEIFSTQKNEYKVLGASIGSELHEIGIRMVIDLFEYAGYNTHYLGGNIPYESFVSFVKDYQPDIILISVTLTLHLTDLKKTIKKIRSDSTLKNAKIIIGGQPFMNNPMLYKEYGADAYTKNAKDAVKVGDRLVRSN